MFDEDTGALCALGIACYLSEDFNPDTDLEYTQQLPPEYIKRRFSLDKPLTPGQKNSILGFMRRRGLSTGALLSFRDATDFLAYANDYLLWDFKRIAHWLEQEYLPTLED